jgi:hypothetical protein
MALTKVLETKPYERKESLYEVIIWLALLVKASFGD